MLSPALLMSLFPYICNRAKLQNDNEGVLMMGQGGGLMCLGKLCGKLEAKLAQI